MTMRTRNALSALLASAAILTLAGQASAAQLLSNSSFETPNLGTGGYTYPGHSWGNVTPIGATQGGWTFNGSALVNASGGNAWYSGSAPAGMDGVQFAALQGTSTLSQTFMATGSNLYLSWLDAGRGMNGMGDQSYQVLLNGSAVGGTFSTLSNEAFGLNTLDFSGLTNGQNYELKFVGLANTDQTAFLDNVQLFDVKPPAPPKAPSIAVLGGDLDLGQNEFMIQDYDHPLANGFTYARNANTYVRSGGLGLWPGHSAPPPGDLTNYETVEAGGHITLTSLKALQSLSFYMGSPDGYNSVKFSNDDGFSWTLQGKQVWGGAPDANGDQSWGRRIGYDFGGYGVTKVEFFSSGNSFEFDSIAGAFKGGGAVPEPATWAMMILGFGAMGAVLRRRREAFHPA